MPRSQSIRSKSPLSTALPESAKGEHAHERKPARVAEAPSRALRLDAGPSGRAGLSLLRAGGRADRAPDEGRPASKCPPVYDQGQLGSCTANAIAAAFEFDQRKQKLDDFMPSRLFIYYNEREIEGTVGADSGAMIRDGIKVVAKLGVCTEDTWPYDIAKFTEAAADEGLHRGGEAPGDSSTAASPPPHQMQGCLAQGFPFVFGFTVYESFEARRSRRPARCRCRRGASRCSAATPCSPSATTTRSSVHRAQLVGPEVGDEGLLQMPYGYVTDPQLASDFWAIYTVEEPA